MTSTMIHRVKSVNWRGSAAVHKETGLGYRFVVIQVRCENQTHDITLFMADGCEPVIVREEEQE